jgi:sugar lactone lactonase YvrE
MHIMRMLVLALLAGAVSEAGAKPPMAEPLEVFASSIAGPEGLAFTRRDGLVVGTTTGDLLRLDADGTATVLASVGDALAGITVLRDGRILAAALGADRVWSISPDGSTSVLASGIGGPNFIVQTRRRERVLVSTSLTGNIVDITSGTPVVVASGLSFPNGLAILPFADGIAFDRARNLLVVGGGMLQVIRSDTGAVETLSSDPLLDWPSNLAFGRGRGFRGRDVYLVNFGPGLGDGTTVVRFRYNHGGVSLIR